MFIDTSVLIDLAILGALVVGACAFMGTISNVLGMKIFGGKNVNRFVNKTDEIQKGWKKVGGNQL